MPRIENTKIYLKRYLYFLWSHKLWAVLPGTAAALLILAFIFLSYKVVEPYKRYVLEPNDTGRVARLNKPVGIVLGAGVTKDGKPFKELQARLDVAARALNNGEVRKLLLSGDNRFQWYDEPKAMQAYLTATYHIPADRLQVDDAGRSTYESCDRAARVFGLKAQPVILFSAGSHLPRAIFLCRYFGVQAYGISSNVEANNAARRELLARPKALFNAYVHGENTILGKQIPL